METLSKHDLDIIQQIEEIRDTYGWSRWHEIALLAKNLKCEKEKNLWLKICKEYWLKELNKNKK